MTITASRSDQLFEEWMTETDRVLHELNEHSETENDG